MARLQTVGEARRHDLFPQQVALCAVAQVDFVAQFAGPAGARHHKGNTVKRDLPQPVVFQIADAVAKERHHDVTGLRALQLQRRNVRFADLNIHARVHGHALRPKQDVAVRQRDPKVVLSEAQQDRIVQDAAVRICDQDVLALPHGHLGQVARCQHLHEPRSVGSGDLHLPLDRHVAEDRIVHEVPEILLRVAEIARDIHVVVDRKALCAPTHSSIEIG